MRKKREKKTKKGKEREGKREERIKIYLSIKEERKRKKQEINKSSKGEIEEGMEAE